MVATTDRARLVARGTARAKRLIDNVLESVSPVYRGHQDQVFGATSYAQCGEDLIVANVFKLLGVQRPSYLDIGGHHPLHCSNTAFFYMAGSRGVVVEANPDLIAPYRAARPEDLVVNVGAASRSGNMKYYRIDRTSGRNSFSEESARAFVEAYPQFRIQDVLDVEVCSLADIIERYCSGRFPDFLSIDVEGLDTEILRSYDFATRPTVICAEFVSAGSEVGDSISNVLSAHGYLLYARTWGNGIYLTQEAARQLSIPSAVSH